MINAAWSMLYAIESWTLEDFSWELESEVAKIWKIIEDASFCGSDKVISKLLAANETFKHAKTSEKLMNH